MSVLLVAMHAETQTNPRGPGGESDEDRRGQNHDGDQAGDQMKEQAGNPWWKGRLGHNKSINRAKNKWDKNKLGCGQMCDNMLSLAQNMEGKYSIIIM